jgi:hypothetical protein
MEPDLGMFGQELLDCLGLVSGEVVQHDVDLLGPTRTVD